jgi:hypothetical protein
VSDILKAASYAAGLSEKDKRKIDNLSKALAVHKNLLAMPSNAANAIYKTLPEAQQQNLVDTFGNETEKEKPRGILGTANHYTFYQGYKALNFLSDTVSRTYRAAVIPLIERKELGFAWDEAGENGEKVYNSGRFESAIKKYGNAQINIAQKISEGVDVEDLIQNATEEEKYYLRIADPRNRNIVNGVDLNREAREEFDEALLAVNAAKFSPGRQLANIIDTVTPGDLYSLSTPKVFGLDVPLLGEKGFFYKMVSGVGDALFRLRTDPFLVLSKAKRLYDISNYAVDVVTAQAGGRGVKFAKYFDQPSTVALWDKAGVSLKKLKEAKGKNPQAAAEARKELSILMPEFGRSVVDEFIKGPTPITSATTAKAWFENSRDVLKVITDGAVARRRVILPRMTPTRKARVFTFTQANKVFDIGKISPSLVNAVFGSPDNADGLLDDLVQMEPGKLREALDGVRVKGTARLSLLQIAYGLDKIKRSFTPVPMFKNQEFDLLAKDSADQIYRLAVVFMPTNFARIMKELYSGTESVAKKMSIYQALLKQTNNVRGLDLTDTGNTVSRILSQKGNIRFGLGEGTLSRKALLPSEMNTVVSAPGLADLDILAGKSTIAKVILGTANSKWVEGITNGWSFLTLAGPRYAIRNAGEDLMVALAMGTTPWGLVKQKYVATRFNTVLQTAKGLDKMESFAANPLGVMLRFINKKESESNAVKILAIDKEIVAGREELFRLKKELYSMTAITYDAKKSKALASQIAKLEDKIEGGIAGQVRKLLAESLSKGKMDSFLRQFGIKLVDDESIDILTEQVIYGSVDNLLSEVSEGASNFAMGSTYNESALQLVKDLGVDVRPLKLDLTTSKNRYTIAANRAGFGTRAITSDKSESSLVGYLLRLSFYGNDELGSLALANIDLPEEQTMKILLNWLRDSRGKKLKSEATAVNELDIDDITYAREVLDRAKQLVTRRSDGTINKELLNKIRQYDPSAPLGKGVNTYTITGKLGLDDVRDMNIGDLPAEYVGPELVPVVEESQRTYNLIKNGWVWLGLANARLSRQPMALYEAVRIRKEMRNSGFEQKFIDDWTKGFSKGSVSYSTAVKSAKIELAKAAEERAIIQVLSYVDNPLIRSQGSFAIRNFARFYRAQEDFYRRLGRLAKYNPEAFVRAALVFDGIDHNGYIQKDDQGNSYFVYPHFAPGYRAVQVALKGMGIPQDFKVPFPVQFGGSIKMLTPSLNPDSILPTFSGPLGALSVTMLTNVANFLPFEGAKQNADTVTGLLLGKYAIDQPLMSRLMPAHVNRAITALSQDERDSQYASAYRKAITYLEASGNGLSEKYDENGNLIAPSIAEKEAYRQKLKNTTLSILAVRFVYGFAAPASPSIQLKSEMSEWIRDSGKASWKQVWYGLLEKNNGDTNVAMQKWVELYPNQVPYTVSESERKTVAYFQAAEDSGKFVEENTDLFKTYKDGAAFLIPHQGAFSWDALATMKDMGLRENKRVEDYLLEVQTASDAQTYYDKKDAFDSSVSNIVDPETRKILRRQYNTWKDTYMAGRPMLEEYLGKGRENAIERVRALDDLSAMLDDPKFSNIRPATQNVLREMVAAYQGYVKQKDVFDLIGGNNETIDIIKTGTLRRIKDLSNFNENTMAAYMSIFSRLLGE